MKNTFPGVGLGGHIRQRAKDVLWCLTLPLTICFTPRLPLASANCWVRQLRRLSFCGNLPNAPGLITASILCAGVSTWVSSMPSQREEERLAGENERLAAGWERPNAPHQVFS